MIMILMEWAYMATLSFLMGFACLAPFRKKGGCQIHSAVTYMMAGLLVLNVYAEYFSLFAGVGFWASLIAVFAAVIGGMLLRQDLADFFKISKIQACQKKKERSDEGIENSKSLWRKKKQSRLAAVCRSDAFICIWLVEGLYALRYGTVSCTGNSMDRRVRRCAGACESAQPVRLQQRFLCTQRLL